MADIRRAVRDCWDALTVEDSLAAGDLVRNADPQAGSLYDELQRRGLGLDAMEDALIEEAVARAGGNLAAVVAQDLRELDAAQQRFDLTLAASLAVLGLALAAATGAPIIGFNVRAQGKATQLADAEGVAQVGPVDLDEPVGVAGVVPYVRTGARVLGDRLDLVQGRDRGHERAARLALRVRIRVVDTLDHVVGVVVPRERAGVRVHEGHGGVGLEPVVATQERGPEHALGAAAVEGRPREAHALVGGVPQQLVGGERGAGRRGLALGQRAAAAMLKLLNAVLAVPKTVCVTISIRPQLLRTCATAYMIYWRCYDGNALA